MTSTAANTRDIHSPANVAPEDYDYFGFWDWNATIVSDEMAMMVALAGPEAAAAFRASREAEIERRIELRAEIRSAGYQGNFEAKGTCDHCGANFIYGSIFRHVPTGQLVVVGWICADETFDVPDRAALDQKRARERAAHGRERLRVLTSTIAWVTEDTTRIGVIGWLISHQDESGFYSDLLAKLRKYGPLSERQEAAVRKGPAQEAARAARAAEAAQAGPVPTGSRLLIEGEVLTTKWQESMYGGALKMLVKLANGSKVWGSVPSSIEVAKGDTVRFNANVEASNDDPSFGFFKRPTKATVTMEAGK